MVVLLVLTLPEPLLLATLKLVLSLLTVLGTGLLATLPLELKALSSLKTLKMAALLVLVLPLKTVLLTVLAPGGLVITAIKPTPGTSLPKTVVLLVPTDKDKPIVLAVHKSLTVWAAGLLVIP